MRSTDLARVATKRRARTLTRDYLQPRVGRVGGGEGPWTEQRGTPVNLPHRRLGNRLQCCALVRASDQCAVQVVVRKALQGCKRGRR